MLLTFVEALKVLCDKILQKEKTIKSSMWKQ